MIRLSKAESLAQQGDVSGLQRLLRRGTDWLDRMEAAEALAKLGHQTGIDYLVECLKDPDGEVRAVAIEMLQELDDPRGNQALKEISLDSIYEIIEDSPDTQLECGNCGNIIPTNAKVCPRCGIQLFGDKIRFATGELARKTDPSPLVRPVGPVSTPVRYPISNPSGSQPGEVVVVDFNIPFLSLVGLLVKVALASIPALLILGAIFGLIFLLFGGVLAGILASLSQ